MSVEIPKEVMDTIMKMAKLEREAGMCAVSDQPTTRAMAIKYMGEWQKLADTIPEEYRAK